MSTINLYSHSYTYADTHWHVCKHVHTHDICHIHKHGYWGSLIICMIKTSNKTFKGKCYLFYSWSMSVLSMTNWLQILVKTSWYGSTWRGISSYMLDKKKERTSQEQDATNNPKVSLLSVTGCLQWGIHFWNSQHGEASWDPRI